MFAGTLIHGDNAPRCCYHGGNNASRYYERKDAIKKEDLSISKDVSKVGIRANLLNCGWEAGLKPSSPFQNLNISEDHYQNMS